VRLDCLVMAGGRATRMGGVAKPLLDVCGKPVVYWVVRALWGLCRRVVVVYSKATQAVGELCRGPLGPVECIEGVGGYVEDLRLSLNLASPPILVVPADTPFIDRNILEFFVTRALLAPEPVVNLVDVERGAVGVTLFKDRGGPWTDVTIRGGYKLLDINTWQDYEEAVRLCRDITGTGLI